MSYEFNRHNVPNHGDTSPKLHFAVTSEANATKKSYRPWYSRPSVNLDLRVDERSAKARIANEL
jgi:hypothetical protein